MPETPSSLNCAELAAFFAEFAIAKRTAASTQDFAGSLAQFFTELPTIPSGQVVPDQSYPFHSDLIRIFDQLQSPLDAVISRGGVLNLWAIAGLKQNEVRTAGALAGLWWTDFGGATSRDFLTYYLKLAVKHVHWERELHSGYRVFTEVNPLGASCCSIPDDHIDPRRSAFFMARSVMRDIRDGVRPC